jgi:hypothetical protein
LIGFYLVENLADFNDFARSRSALRPFHQHFCRISLDQPIASAWQASRVQKLS